MKSLALGEKTIPKKDVVAGVGVSILVHVLVFSTAFIWTLVMPHKPLKPPYCTVNLVSLKDLEIGSSEPKGSPKAAEEMEVPGNVPDPGKVHHKPEPVAPIKRLAVDESAVKPEAQIKKIEPKEAPVAPQKPQDLEKDIEKNLDNLIAKPHAIPHTSTPSAQQSEPQPKAPAQPASEKMAQGIPTGAAEGGQRGTTHGSTSGTPEGSTATNRLVSMYGEQIRQKIESQWRFPNDQGISGLKVVVEVQIRRTGEIVSIRIMARSGNELFDDAAVRAVNGAVPLPPVPEAIAQSINLILTFVPGRVS